MFGSLSTEAHNYWWLPPFKSYLLSAIVTLYELGRGTFICVLLGNIYERGQRNFVGSCCLILGTAQQVKKK